MRDYVQELYLLEKAMQAHQDILKAMYEQGDRFSDRYRNMCYEMQAMRKQRLEIKRAYQRECEPELPFSNLRGY